MTRDAEPPPTRGTPAACVRPPLRDPAAVLARTGREVVRATLLGEGDLGARLEAVEIWSRAAGAPEDDLGRVVADERSAVELRVAAVRGVARVGGANGRAILREAAASPDRSVAGAALKSLGEMGTPEDLDIVLARGRGDDLVAARARFAAALVTHRYGLVDRAPPLSPDALLGPPRAPRPIRWQRAARADHAALSASTKRVHEVATDADLAFLLRCEKSTFGVLLNPAVAGDLEARLTRPTVLGLVVRWLPLTRTYGMYMLILGAPAPGGGVTLLVHQDNGRPRYAGTGTIAGAALRFSLSTVSAPGAGAIAIAGTIDPSGLHLDMATYSAFVDVPKRVPAPM